MQIIRNIPNFNIGPGPCKFVDSFPFIKGQVCSTKCDNILNFLKIQYKHEILRVVFWTPIKKLSMFYCNWGVKRIKNFSKTACIPPVMLGLQPVILTDSKWQNKIWWLKFDQPWLPAPLLTRCCPRGRDVWFSSELISKPLQFSASILQSVEIYICKG